ncbi:MAG: 4Fe-4S dicluster domain-containing protein [Anaerobutyricum soehngenii]
MKLAKEDPCLFQRKEECCGCTACYAICPREAIEMIEDEEGFEYPEIDKEKCIRCFRCIKVCPMKIS